MSIRGCGGGTTSVVVGVVAHCHLHIVATTTSRRNESGSFAIFRGFSKLRLLFKSAVYVLNFFFVVSIIFPNMVPFLALSILKFLKWFHS